MTATSWPIRARPSASDAPTRPHPITTTRTFAVLSAVSSKLPSLQICALGTLQPNAVWAYSWLSCPSFRPPRGGWSSAGRSAATGWPTPCCRSGSPCRSSLPTRCRRWPMPPRRSSWCCRWPAWPRTRWRRGSGSRSAAVMLIVIASYRQNVHAYPSGGGDYEVVTTNLGPDRRPDGGQRADGGLRAHRRGFDGVGDVQHRIGGALHQHSTRCCSPSLAILILASANLRGIRGVRHRVRHPDLRLHDRHVHHARLGPVPDLRARRSAAGRVGAISTCTSEHGDIIGLRAGVPGGPVRSRPAARR